MRYTDRVPLIGCDMTRTILALVLLGLIATTQTQAGENAAEKSKGGNSIDRTVENTGKKLGKTADRVEKSVQRGLKTTEKAINTTGEKAGKAINSTVDRTGKRIKEKTD